MANEGLVERPFPSTTFAWRRVMVGRPAGGQQANGPKGRRWFGLSRADWRKPITIKVKYRGGAQAWFEIHARGSMGRFEGATSLVDVLAEITRQDLDPPPK